MIELQERLMRSRVVPEHSGWRYYRAARRVADGGWRLPRRTILIGDAIDKMRTLPPSSVDCCVTSPPFYQLRDYGVPGQIGLEPNVSDWVTNLQAVMHEVARVLKPTGGLWLNLGDSFSRHDRYGAPPKGLLCAPERLVLALTEAGWVVRNRVVWAKPNPMPTSVMDRLNLTHETVFYLVRSAYHYYFDLDAIREPHRSRGSKRGRPPLGKAPSWAGPLAGSQDGLRRARPDGVPGHALGKNPGDVWQIPTSGFRGAHFATFPEGLVRKPLLATCPEKVCTVCNQPWRRAKATAGSSTGAQLGDLVPCGCSAPTMPGVVLDPFMGSGTVAVVAERLGRDWLGIELNPSYGELATQRIETARRRQQGGQPKEVMSPHNERRAA